jgi:hypothetical protein
VSTCQYVFRIQGPSGGAWQKILESRGMGLKSWTVGHCEISRRFGGLTGEWRMLVMSARSVIGDAGKDNERGFWLALLVAGRTVQVFSLWCEVVVAGGDGDEDEVGVSMKFDEFEEVML